LIIDSPPAPSEDHPEKKKKNCRVFVILPATHIHEDTPSPLFFFERFLFSFFFSKSIQTSEISARKFV
jgi:hypothetical protein